MSHRGILRRFLEGNNVGAGERLGWGWGWGWRLGELALPGSAPPPRALHVNFLN